MKNGIYIGTYPIKIALIGAIVGFAIITFAFNTIKRKIQSKDIYCNIEINFNSKKVELKALIDTGNFLKEPITGAFVVIVESASLREIFPDILLKNIKNILEGKIEQGEISDEYMSRLRVIPFSSLGKQNAMLLGIKVDYLNIYRSEEDDKTVKNVVVGIYEGSLTKNESYRALINLEMLEEGEKHESIRYAKI